MLQLVSCFVFIFVSLLNLSVGSKLYPNKHEKEELKLKTIEMFDHAYGSYKKYAHPADELMPLSCKGRYRESEKSRGDIDEALGNFSLTLIDTLDTLVVLGKLEEFETQVRYVIANVSFNADAVVSVFETNIRVLGGLLGAHSVAVDLRNRGTCMLWYHDELLIKAVDIGDRLLAAFNTSTGIPYPKVNLRYGINTPNSRVGHERDTCTACAGTMIMEFGALSRLTGNSKYEEKAHAAMDALWKYRSRHSDLVGTTINIHNGEWVRRDSGIGAGIDSYYEYCLKAYILLGDDSYLAKFNKHYAAINKYVKQGYMLIDVLMHEPDRRVRNSVDALQAFWPGLQVLKGDLKPAIETHEILYKVAKKYKFLPESFSTNLDINWAQHPLRPEFVESTYFLYQATKDPYYLVVGKHILESLEEHARVPCGFAALSDLRTYTHEDKMDSFVLAETFKYLYLLFSDESEHVINIHDYLFTTEAHMLPLYLSLMQPSNQTNSSVKTPIVDQSVVTLTIDELMSCPNERYVHNGLRTFAEMIRHQVNKGGHFEKPYCQSSSSTEEESTQKFLQSIKISANRPRKLKALDFVVTNDDHLIILKELGITLRKEESGKVQLIHQAAQAKTSADAEEGILFMQEMIELAKTREGIDYQTRVVTLMSSVNRNVMFAAGSAQFGPNLDNTPQGISGEVVEINPYRACNVLENPNELKDRIAVVERGDCMFIDKVRLAQTHGSIGVIIVDHVDGTSAETSQPFGMSGDNNPGDVKIPAVFLFRKEGDQLRAYMQQENNGYLRVMLSPKIQEQKVEQPTPQPTMKEVNDATIAKQDIVIDEHGGKKIVTTKEYIEKDVNGVWKRYRQVNTKTCPTSHCDQGVKETVSIYVKDLKTAENEADKAENEADEFRTTTAKSSKGTIGEFKTTTFEKNSLINEEDTGEELDSIISEELENKISLPQEAKTERICTSAGCFKDLDELKQLSSVTDAVLKELRNLKKHLHNAEDFIVKDGDEVLIDNFANTAGDRIDSKPVGSDNDDSSKTSHDDLKRKLNDEL